MIPEPGGSKLDDIWRPESIQRQARLRLFLFLRLRPVKTTDQDRLPWSSDPYRLSARKAAEYSEGERTNIPWVRTTQSPSPSRGSQGCRALQTWRRSSRSKLRLRLSLPSGVSATGRWSVSTRCKLSLWSGRPGFPMRIRWKMARFRFLSALGGADPRAGRV